MNNKKMVCELCGKEVEELTTVGDYEICEECVDERTEFCYHCEERYFSEDMNSAYSEEMQEEVYLCDDCHYNIVAICDCCESSILEEDGIEIVSHLDEDIFVCKSCYEDRRFYCEYHERTEIDTSRWEDGTLYVEGYGTICSDSYEYSGDFTYCEDCGNLFHCDNMNYCEADDCGYCDSCIEYHENDGYITSYHDHDYDEKFMNEEETEEEIFFFGSELEVERKNEHSTECGEMSEILYDLDKDDVLNYERDGSLNDGFEIITKPLSFNYIVDNQEFFKDMINTLEENKYQSYATHTCGHHIHISENLLSLNQQMLFLSIFEFFKEEFTILSRRREINLDRWSSFATSEYSKECLDENRDRFRRILKNHMINKSKYSAVNFRHSETLEIRIWRGTLNGLEYLSRFEIVKNIAKYVIDNEDYLIDIFEDGNSSYFELNLYDIITYETDYFTTEYLTSKDFMKVVNTKFMVTI